MYKFKIGDKVRLKKQNSGNNFPGEAEYMGDSTTSSLSVVLKRDDGKSGSGQNNWWNFDKAELHLLELTKPFYMPNLIEKAKMLFTSEPEKSFQKTGITDSSNNLTPDGAAVFLNWLLTQNKDAFNTAVVQPLLAEQEKEKK